MFRGKGAGLRGVRTHLPPAVHAGGTPGLEVVAAAGDHRGDDRAVEAPGEHRANGDVAHEMGEDGDYKGQMLNGKRDGVGKREWRRYSRS